MKLPNVDAAIVSESKIVEYLLNASHPDGASRAVFFQRVGFRLDDWQVLADALRHMANVSPVVATMETVHGQKYIVDGTIETPNGARAMLRSVWIVDRGQSSPRLVTAYPHGIGIS